MTDRTQAAASLEHQILARLTDAFATLTQLVRHGTNHINYGAELTRLEAVAAELTTLLDRFAKEQAGGPPPTPPGGATPPGEAKAAG